MQNYEAKKERAKRIIGKIYAALREEFQDGFEKEGNEELINIYVTCLVTHLPRDFDDKDMEELFDYIRGAYSRLIEMVSDRK